MITETDRFNQILTKCCTIIKNNDKLSSDGVFDEISKILFMKNQYDRKCRMSEKSFSPEEFSQYLNHASEEIKREMKDDRLEKEIKKIQLKKVSLEQIVEEIGTSNLPEMPDDVKGPIYQEFMVKTLNKQLRQFFTPQPIVDFMVNILDPCQGELICDPCCGRGAFLTKSLQYLRTKTQSQAGKTQSLSEHPSNPNHCIFGVDANPRMAWAAKLNMMMHGGIHDGIHYGDGLLNKKGLFENRFDVIFANPPFGGRVTKELTVLPIDCMTEEEITDYGIRLGPNAAESLRLVKSNVGRPILERFDLGRKTKFVEVLFIERCLRLLKPGGRMGIILPESILNSDKFQEMRDYVEWKAKLILLASLPKEAFLLSGVKVKAGIVCLKKFTKEEAVCHRRILNAAKESANKRFDAELRKLKHSTKGGKGNKQQLRKLQTQKDDEIRRFVKKKFNYLIPMVSLEKDAEDGTCGLDEDYLHEIAAKYTDYRKENKLWESSSSPS
jgi:type I restriction enzyme M protein